MRKFTLPSVETYIRRFLPVSNAFYTVALAGAMVLGMGTASAAVTDVTFRELQKVNISRSGNVVTVSFINLDLDGQASAGTEFLNLSQIVSSTFLTPPIFTGALISIGGNFALNSYDQNTPQGDQTWASDLTVYIVPQSGSSAPAISGAVLQLGGTNTIDVGIASSNRLFWEPPHSSASVDDVLSVNRTVVFSTLSIGPFALLDGSDPTIWLANSLSSAPVTTGQWSGDITFTFAASGGSGVPDASRTALLLAPGTLLLLGLAGRSRRRG